MKILIVQLGRIGDMILATPMFGAVKRKYPDGEVSVLASVVNNGIIRNNPNVDKIYVLDKAPHKLAVLMTELLRKKFDYLIDAKDHYSTESSIIAKTVRAGKKIGFNPGGKNNFDIGIDGDKENAGLHFVLRCFKPLKHIGIEMPGAIPKPELYPSDISKLYVNDFLNDTAGRKILVINLSASYRAKMWDNDKWEEFILSLNTDEFFPIVTFAPADRDIAEDLMKKVKIAVFRSRSMDDVTALIAKSDILVTPDTSLVHVAAAFDKPLLGLFSGLDDFYEKFRPLSSVFEVVRSPKGVDGIKAITAGQAIQGFSRLTNKINNNDNPTEQ